MAEKETGYLGKGQNMARASDAIVRNLDLSIRQWGAREGKWYLFFLSCIRKFVLPLIEQMSFEHTE